MKVCLIRLQLDQNSAMYIEYINVDAIVQLGRYHFPKVYAKLPLGQYAGLDVDYTKDRKEFMDKLLKAWAYGYSEGLNSIQAMIWCRQNPTSFRKAKNLVIDKLCFLFRKNWAI